MNPNYTFSFIMGYRHNIERLFNLKRVLDWVNGFSGVEVILVEQDTHSKISHLNLKCKHIFVKSDMPYNRSWGFNIGLKNMTTNIAIFSDTDIIMEPNRFGECIKELNTYDMISPYKSVIDLEQKENTLPFKAILNIDRPGRGDMDNQKINISGGISMFRRDSIVKIGGWSEDFIGWGGEDDFQTIKIENFLKWKEMDGKCYHFFHTKSSPDMKYYKRTLSLLENAKKMSKENLERNIINSSQKIGMLNKYDNF